MQKKPVSESGGAARGFTGSSEVNENKINDGYRERASFEAEVF